MFYFKFLSIDATKESKELGRLINHSKKNSNLRVQILNMNGNIHLIFIASRKLQINEELFFDYNENRSRVLAANPWLNL